jgi:GT2 family glycosyltransferase
MNPVREVRSQDQPGVLAILPHHGSPATTQEAIRSLQAQEYEHLAVHVLDNSGVQSGAESGTKGTAVDREDLLTDLCESLGTEGIELERPDRNLGYCAAINRGLARAIAEDIPYLCLVNPDVRIEPDCLARLVEALEARPDVAGVGPLLTTAKGSRIWSAGSKLRFGPNQIAHLSRGRPVCEAPGRPARVDFLPGALALYRSKDLQEMGGLDEQYFMYCEDVDLGLRLTGSGHLLLYLPWARAEHQGAASSGGGVSPLCKFLMGVNTPRFLRRAGSARLWLSFLIFDLLGWFPSLFLHLPRRRHLRAHLAKGRGMILGLFGYRPGVSDVGHYLGGDS